MTDDLWLSSGEAFPHVGAACNVSGRFAPCTVFTRGLALSLLQRNRTSDTASTQQPPRVAVLNAAASSPNKDKNTGFNATAPSAVVVVPTDNKGAPR